MSQLRPFLLLLTAGLLAQLPARGTDRAEVPYPNGYRHWTFLHSSMVSSTFGPFKNKPLREPLHRGHLLLLRERAGDAGAAHGLLP